ncbi:MAG: hypothetical protein O7F76_12655 [Planctomycetota bacterium]|nr:hypothetical protein [Planctomycetota bacterium]
MLAVAASILLHGYYFGTDDHLGILPMYRALFEPGTYEADWYIQAEREMNVRLYYIMFLRAASIPLGLPGASFVWYVVFGAILYGGLYRLAAAFLRDSRLALLAAFIAVLSPLALLLGHSKLVNQQLIPSLPAYALSVWALVAALRDRPLQAGVLLGFAALAQGLVGLLAGVLVAATFLVEHRQRFSARWKSWALGGALAAVVASPNILLVLSARPLQEMAAATFEDFSIYARLRIPWHVLPGTWPLAAWASGALMLAFVMRALVGQGLIRRKAFRALVVLLLLGFACATVCVELMPITAVAKLQLFRGMVLFRVLFVIALLFCLHRRYAGDSRILPIVLAVAAAGCMQDTLWLGTGPVLLSATFVGGRRAGRIIGLSAAAALVVAMTAQFGEHRHEIMVLALMSCILWAVLYFAWNPIELTVPAWTPAAATLGLVVGFAGVIPLRSGPMATTRIADRLWRQCNKSMPDDRPRNAAQRAAQWAGRNLPRDAVVLVAPHLKDFRYRSARAVVVDFKAVPFTTAGLREWRNRLYDVCGAEPDVKITGAGYSDLAPFFLGQSGADLARTAERYDAEYLAVERDMTGPWELIHQENAVRLYRRDGERSIPSFVASVPDLDEP